MPKLTMSAKESSSLPISDGALKDVLQAIKKIEKCCCYIKTPLTYAP